MQTATFKFPLRVVDKDHWCALSYCGIKRIDVVAYKVHTKQNHSFAGGHRHRMVTCSDDVHILFQSADLTIDITDVTPTKDPPRRQGHGHKRR